MRLIYNSDAQRLQKNFDDKTPITVSELFRSERTASVPIELFLIDNDGGYATPGTSDYEVLIGRQAQAITTGKLTLTFTGTTEEIDLSKPKLATRIEAALNAVSEVNAAGGVDVVELKNGRAFQITFRSVGSRAAITAGVKDSMQPASVIISEVTAGTGSTREVQLLTLEEASLAEISTSGWSANSNPALAISTLVEGTANTREVVQLSVTGDPAPGSFFVVSNSEPISTEATAAQVKTILNSALSSDIGSVKKTGERIWQITYKTNGDKTALSAGTHNLVKRPSVTGTLSLNTTALAYAANSDGSDLSVGFTLKKSNEVLLSENVDLAEPFAEVIGSSAMLNNDSLGALFTIGGDAVNKGTAISLSGGLTYSSDTLAAPFLPLAGGTMTGALNLGDNINAQFGDSQQLKIYHNGANNAFIENSTTYLVLESSAIILRNTAGNEDYAKFLGDGGCEFYFNNSKKLETTDTGATISGKLIVNGDMDVSGTTTTFNSTVVTVDDPVFTVGGDTAPGSDDNKDRGIEFRYYSGSAKVGFFGYDDSADAFTFLTDATNNSEVFSGTLGKLRIGDLSLASSDITLNDSHLIQWTDGTYKIQGSKGGGYLKFFTNGAEAARFDSSGRLGIGGAPSAKLDIYAAPNTNSLFLRDSSDSEYTHNFYIDSSGNGHTTMYAEGNAAKIAFSTSGDSYFNGGNLVIGATTASAKLDVQLEAGAWNVGSSFTNKAVRISGGSGGLGLAYDDTTGATIAAIHHGNSWKKINFGAVEYHYDINGSEVMRLNSTGLGIGGTPSAFLHVSKDNDNSGNQFCVADTEGTSAAVRTYTHGGDAQGLILNHYYALAGSGNEYMRYADIVSNVGNGAGTAIRFITKNAANTYSSTIIDNEGRLGIGGNDPSSQYFNNLVIGNNNAGDKGLTIRSSSSDRGIIAFSDSDSATADRYDGFIAYEHANQALAFYTNAANERMRIDSSGNVGIACTNPGDFHSEARNLVVGSGTGTQGITISTGTSHSGSIYFADGTSGNEAYRGFVQYRHGDDRIDFGAGGGARMSVTSGGHCGIGTTAPSCLLDIYNASGWGELHLDGSSGGELKLQKAGTTHLDLYASDSGSTGSVIKAQSNLLISSNNTTDANRSIYLNSSGNCGIGTTIPRTKFHICGNDPDDDATAASAAGAFLVSNSANTYGIEMGVSSSGDGWIQSHSVTADSQYPLLLNPLGGNVGIGTTSPTKAIDARGEGRVWNGANGCELSYSTGNTSAIYASANTSGNIEFRTDVGATAKMFIANGGNVGIGTTSPVSTLTISQDDGASHTDFGYDGLTLSAHESASEPSIITFRSANEDANLANSAKIGSITTGTGSTYNGNLVFSTRSGGSIAERMRIDSSGNLCLGNTSASAKLDIRQDSGVALRCEDGTGAYFTVDQNGDLLLKGSSPVMTVNSTNATSGFRINVTGLDADNDLLFRVQDNGTNRFKINRNGDVGINGDPSANADLTLGNGELCMAETTTPTADANFGKIYCKADNKLYFQDGAGTEHEIAFA